MDMNKEHRSGRLMQIHSDRVIVNFPGSYTKAAQIDQKYDFDPRVQRACSNEEVLSIGLKICKMIIIGDVSVGKTSLVNRFCKKAFDNDYKATIGVDFEVERFEILNSPYTVQMWDTAGQERFQCIAAAYYRGTHIVTIVFDVSNMATLASATKWLTAAQKENTENHAVLVFLVGTKKDLLTSNEYNDVEKEAIKIAKNLRAEYWGVSSKTGENVKDFFFRVAALSFEGTVLREFERRSNSPSNRIGSGMDINLKADSQSSNEDNKLSCCKT